MIELKFQQVVKTVVAVVGAVIAVALTLWTDGEIQKWLVVANAALTALGVYLFPNKSDERRPDLSVQD